MKRWLLDVSESESSDWERARTGGSSQLPPNFGAARSLEAATAACSGAVASKSKRLPWGSQSKGVMLPPLPLEPGGGRAAACLSRARDRARGRHARGREGERERGQARGREAKGTGKGARGQWGQTPSQRLDEEGTLII